MRTREANVPSKYDERPWLSVHDTTGEFDVQGFTGGLVQAGGDMTLLMQLEDMLNRFAGTPPRGRRP